MRTRSTIQACILVATLSTGASLEAQPPTPGDDLYSLGFESIPAGTRFVTPSIVVEGDLKVEGTVETTAGVRFPDGTLQTTAARAAEKTTLVVSPAGEPLASGQALRDALASITDASALRPYIVKLEPGIYDVTSAAGNSLLMKPWVSIEGSGETVTEIRSEGSPDVLSGTVVTADLAELRRLTVRNFGQDQVAIAILVIGTETSLDHVTAIAAGGSSFNYGIRHAGSNTQSRLFDVSAQASGGLTAYGITMRDLSEVILTRVTARAFGAGTKIALFAINEDGPPDMTVRLDGVVAEATGTAFSAGFRIDGDAIAILRRSIISASGAAQNFGVDINNSHPSTPVVIAESTVTASGPQSIGVRNTSAPEVRIDQSRIFGQTQSLSSVVGSLIQIGVSRLGGGPASGDVRCVFSYSDDYLALDQDCSPTVGP